MSKKAFNGPFRIDGFIHYYVRDEKGHPFGCVALKEVSDTATGGAVVCRGVSILSCNDKWDRVRARKLAVGRCKAAINQKRDSMPYRDPYNGSTPPAVIRFMDNVDPQLMTAKSQYDIVPTDFERFILEKTRKNNVQTPVS